MAEPETDKTTLLVVDDSRLMRVAARKILKNDFNIIEASDGEVAWATLQQHPEIALVMSDLSMPNLDGLGLLKRIRESDFSKLPVIIVTGAEDDDGSKKTALAAGASDFITKPFESVQLLARAKSQARQKDTQEALQQSEAETQQLRETSQVDPLTGLANKRAFISHLEENLAYATRHRTELSLLLVRIQKYKVLFLRRGKLAAETLVKELTVILGAGRRREDTVGYIALDTFGIVLPSANLPGAKRVLAQLSDAIDSAEIRVDGEALPFNISFGLCTPDIRPGILAEDVLALAEMELSNPTTTTPGTRITAESPASVTGEAPAPAPKLPVTVPEPSCEPVKYTVATPADIQQALHALANQTQPTNSPDALLRGILPLLDAWNRSHAQRYDTPLKMLREALYPEEMSDTASASPKQPTERVN